MERFFSRIILVLCLILPAVLFSDNNNKSPLIKVMTYNIYHGATMKNDFDLNLIADVINSQNPDLVALQEVDLRTERAHKMDLVLELAKRTNMIPLFGKAMDYDGGEYGEGILSRYSFSMTKNHALPHTRDKEPRAALQAVIQLPSGHKISFIGTHLDHTHKDKNRIMQVRKINQIFKNLEHPAILAGDLNAEPGSRPIDILENHWQSSFQKATPTYPSDKPVKKLDYIMFHPDTAWRIVSKKVIDEKIASDHCPVVVELELLPANQ